MLEIINHSNGVSRHCDCLCPLQLRARHVNVRTPRMLTHVRQPAFLEVLRLSTLQSLKLEVHPAQHPPGGSGRAGGCRRRAESPGQLHAHHRGRLGGRPQHGARAGLRGGRRHASALKRSEHLDSDSHIHLRFPSTMLKICSV